MKSIKLPMILKKYPSGWISVSKDYQKSVAWGKTLRSLMSKLTKLGNPEGYIMRTAKDYSGYIGC